MKDKSADVAELAGIIAEKASKKYAEELDYIARSPSTGQLSLIRSISEAVSEYLIELSYANDEVAAKLRNMENGPATY